MMATRFKVVAACLLLSLTLGCPLGGSSTGLFSDVPMLASITTKGLLFCWWIYQPIAWETGFTATLPPNVIFSPVRSGRVGSFVVDRDFDNVVDFWFPVLTNGSDGLFVDFGFDGSPNGSDITILRVPGDPPMLDVDIPQQGPALDSGSYRLLLDDYFYFFSTPDLSGASNASASLDLMATTLSLDGSSGDVGEVDEFSRTLLMHTPTPSRVLPHLVFGEDTSGVRSAEIGVVNSGGNTEQGQLVFFENNGDALQVKIGDMTSHVHDFEVDPYSTLSVPIDPVGQAVKTAWALGLGGDVDLSVVLGQNSGASSMSTGASLLSDTEQALLGQTGVPGVETKTHQTLAVKRRSNENTALVLVNPTNRSATVELTLTIGAGQFIDVIEVKPRRHLARFPEELFTLPAGDFEGSLKIKSNVSLAMLTLAQSTPQDSTNFDVDGNGAFDALTDGLLLLRYAFGFRGTTLIEGAVASDCTRCTAAEIEPFLAQGATL